MANTRDPTEFLPLTHVTYQVMLAIADTALHGYGIIKDVARRTEGQTALEAGTLYAAIKRLRDDGLIEIAPKSAKERGDSRRRYYRLTQFGRQVLRAESERMAALLEAAKQKRVFT